ncbi:MAG: sporulation protein YqfD [Anaerospora sp.]|nr:sporulation protein YqfD [Anaerospora sp.]
MEIIALAGQPAVKKGDTVRKGDVLIKGIAPDIAPTSPNQPAQSAPITTPPQLVKASGIVKARVWYESSIYTRARSYTKPCPNGGIASFLSNLH